MTGCDECDWHGPEIGDTLEGELRALHRALHDIMREVPRPVRWIARVAGLLR